MKKAVREFLRAIRLPRPSTDRELLDRVEQYVAAERAVAEARRRLRTAKREGNDDLGALRVERSVAVANADEARRDVDRRVRELAGLAPGNGHLLLQRGT